MNDIAKALVTYSERVQELAAENAKTEDRIATEILVFADRSMAPASVEAFSASLTILVQKIMAQSWGDGYVAGLADMQNGQERLNPYKSHP